MQQIATFCEDFGEVGGSRRSGRTWMSYPGAMLVIVNDRTVTPLPATRFADVARRLGAATHAAGLAVPAFRCPPRAPGALRTIRRYPGGAVVSVRLRDRPFA